MWNMNYSNRLCNEYNRIREHKNHLERIVTIKPVIDIKEPSKPSFLIFKAKKEKMEQEKMNKINYENNVLLTKIIDIVNKPSPYNPMNLQVKPCPAFSKLEYIQRKKKFDIDQENLKLYNKLVSAKPHYVTSKMLQENNYNQYLEYMHSNSKNSNNPNLYFETPANFKRKLNQHMNPTHDPRPKSAQVMLRSNLDQSGNNQHNKTKPQSGIPKAGNYYPYVDTK